MTLVFYFLVALTTGQGYLKARGKYARRIQHNAARAGLCDWEVKCPDLVALRMYGKLQKEFTYRYYIYVAQNVRATWMCSCIPYFTVVFLSTSSLVLYFNNCHSV